MHLLMDIWIVETLVIVNNAAVNTEYNYLFQPLFSVLLRMYLGVKLLECIVILCETVRGSTTKLFSIALVPFHIPTSKVLGSNFSTFWPKTYFHLKIIGILEDV